MVLKLKNRDGSVSTVGKVKAAGGGYTTGVISTTPAKASSSSSKVQVLSVAAPAPKAAAPSNSPGVTLTATRTPVAPPAGAIGQNADGTYIMGGSSSPVSSPAPTYNQSSQPGFFTAAGQKQALQRVVSVFNPFDTDDIYWVNPLNKSQNTKSALFSSPVTKVVLDAGLVAGTVGVGASLLGVGGAAGGTAAAAAGGGTAAGLGAGLVSRAALVPAGLGLLAGLALGGGSGGGDATTGDQTTNANQTTTSNQSTTYNTYSPTNNIVRNSISGSPGATIGAVTQSGADISGQNPAQTTSPSQSVDPTQSATGGSGGISPWLLLAGALVLASARE